ncbi:MAG: hypothetical protein WDO14_02685 [Bacteroidota bacterium]
MKRILILLIVLSVSSQLRAQAIFAHNDYLKPRPFYNAFELKVAYIEADVFLENNQLLVAHTKEEIDPSKTLESMYIEPLSQKVKEANGNLYGLTLMIDLKTEGAPTMSALIKLLEKYPEIKTCSNLWITMSGNYPPPDEWKNYPGYITFDGRPEGKYTIENLKRLRLISTSFSSVSNWNGQGEIPPKEEAKLRKVIDQAHTLGFPMRFWAMPDFENAWDKLEAIGLDILNSDKIDELSKHLSN